MRLTLDHLGTVEVRIAKSNDPSAAVRIATDRTQTLHTMIANQAELRSVFEQSGIGWEGQTIEYGLISGEESGNNEFTTNDREGRQRRDERGTTPSAPGPGDSFGSDLAQPTDRPDTQCSIGAIDITA